MGNRDDETYYRPWQLIPVYSDSKREKYVRFRILQKISKRDINTILEETFGN